MVRFLVMTIACDYVNYMALNYPHVHDFHLQHYEISQAILWKQLKWPTSESCRSGLWVRKRQRERDIKENEWIETWRAKTFASVKRHNLSFFLVLAWLRLSFDFEMFEIAMTFFESWMSVVLIYTTHFVGKPWRILVVCDSCNCTIQIGLKGQMNQKLDIFYFSSILVKCVQYEPNKHTMKFQLNWSK